MCELDDEASLMACHASIALPHPSRPFPPHPHLLVVDEGAVVLAVVTEHGVQAEGAGEGLVVHVTHVELRGRGKGHIIYKQQRTTEGGDGEVGAVSRVE